ncbi:MAG TPA: hypothetical protein VGM16_03550 [Gammaproteobacteria bacterium]|jgi:hypothetical protein
MRVPALLILLPLACPPAWADDATAAPPQTSPLGTLTAFAAMEGALGLNAGLAAYDPKGYGFIEVLVSPLAGAELGPKPARVWTGGVGFAAIGTYNMTHYGQDYSHIQVLRENFYALNGLVVAVFIADKLGGDQDAQAMASHLRLTPQAGGGLRLDLHWTF